MREKRDPSEKHGEDHQDKRNDSKTPLRFALDESDKSEK